MIEDLRGPWVLIVQLSDAGDYRYTAASYDDLAPAQRDLTRARRYAALNAADRSYGEYRTFEFGLQWIESAADIEDAALYRAVGADGEPSRL